ncbi:MAG: hypothetical protein GYB67_18645 [Chloroflexi bacterium]|nr:hypothetical protein [Chloroflexota bacterium]
MYKRQFDTLTPSITPTPSETPTITPTPFWAALGTFSGILEDDLTLNAAFLEPAQSHVYLFTGAAGDYATLGITTTDPAVDPRIQLYDPLGEALAIDDDSGGALTPLLQDLRLPRDGEYSLRAQNVTAGSYQISLALAAVPQAPATPYNPTATPTRAPGVPTPRAIAGTVLVDHQPVIGRLGSATGVTRYFFTAEAGEQLTVVASPVQDSAQEPSLEPSLEVIMPSGAPLNVTPTRTRDGAARLVGVTAPESGTYTVFVGAANETPGNFVIGFGVGLSYQPVLVGEALPGETYGGNAELPGTRAIWTVDLNRGDTIGVLAEGLDGEGLISSLALAGPDGTVIAQTIPNAPAATAAIPLVEAPQTGVYDLWMTGQGLIQLRWNYLSRAPTPPPGPTQIRRLFTISEVLPPQTYVYYPFQGQAGQQIRVQVIAGAVGALAGPVDPVATVLDAADTVLIEVDDTAASTNPVFTLALTASGTYRLRVNGYGNSSGPVTVIVDALE